MRKTVLVYLIGGTKSGWQKEVKAAFEDLEQEGAVTLFDPCENPKKSEKCQMTNEECWEEADIMFAHSESSGSCMIFISKPKQEKPEGIRDEKKPEYPPDITEVIYHKEAGSLAEGISILKDEVEITILRKFAS